MTEARDDLAGRLRRALTKLRDSASPIEKFGRQEVSHFALVEMAVLAEEAAAAIEALNAKLAEAEGDFEALRRDYGQAATLIGIMRERWAAVSGQLDYISGGMHAELEDAAGALAEAMDNPKATLAVIRARGEGAA